MAHIIIGVSGASGVILGYRALSALTLGKHHIDLVMTKDAQLTATIEIGPEKNTPEKWVSSLTPQQKKLINCYKIHDFNAPIASGTHPVYGMIILPCSMATLAAISMGLSDNLLRRAADVTLKERRPLVIVPREAPLSEIHLKHMLRITRMGGVIVPPVPCWYNQSKTMEDVENFIVGRAIDALKIEMNNYKRWKT